MCTNFREVFSPPQELHMYIYIPITLSLPPFHAEENFMPGVWGESLLPSVL